MIKKDFNIADVKGYGSVVKISGNRKKPYQVRVVTGMVVNREKEVAYPKYKILCYTKTKKEGKRILDEFHNNPYDLTNVLTFKEVFDLAFDEYVEGKSRSSVLAYNASFKACSQLHTMKFKDIKVIHLQRLIDDSDKNYPTLKKMKVLFNVMYKYAMKYDLVSKDCSRYVEIKKYVHKNPNQRANSKFSNAEIEMLWDVSEDKYYQMALMLIYTGVRINELIELKKENINLKEQYFDVIRSKTKSGIRRVPIADYILPFFENWYNHSTLENLFCTHNQTNLAYDNFLRGYWKPMMEPLGITHTPHATRHTCISMLANKNINQTTIKMIVGHEGKMSLTERIYTHLDPQILLDAVNQLKD